MPTNELAAPKTDAEKLAEIDRKNRLVSCLALAHREAADHAKEAKKSWEAAQHELSALISRLSAPDEADEPLPLFDRPEPAANDGWRIVELSAVAEAYGLPDATLESLVDAGITTLGALADWTAAGKTLTDVKGIGAAKAARVEDALMQFWADHPEWSSPAPAGDEPLPADLSPDGPVAAVVKDAFAALLAVGHTEDQARRAIDRAIDAAAKPFASVADMIDAVYNLPPDPLLSDASEAAGRPVTDPAEARAAIAAEGEAMAAHLDGGDTAWQGLSVHSLMQTAATTNKLLDFGVETLGDLATALASAYSDLGLAKRWGLSGPDVADLRAAFDRHANGGASSAPPPEAPKPKRGRKARVAS